MIRRWGLWGVIAAVAVAGGLVAAGGSGPILQIKWPDGIALKDVQPGLDTKAPFINVRAAPYFAVGDGVADDTAAVASAYTAAATSNALIYFPAGIYKFNLTIVRSGVSIRGSGRSMTPYPFTSTQGGTTFIPADLTKPVIQVGDGTASVVNTSLSSFSILGDGTFAAAGTSTSDGLVVLGARNTFVSDFEINDIGGDSIRITSSAAQASVYTQMARFTVNNYGVRGINVTYGPNFTSATSFSHYNISPNSVVDTARGLYIEGAEVNSVNGWIQANNGYKNVYMRYDSQTNTNAPKLHGSGTTMIDSASSTDVLVNLDMVGTAFNHRLSTQHIDGVTIDGQIKWDTDATTVSMKGTYPNRITGNLEVLGGIAFNAGLNDSRDEQSSPTTRLLQGNGSAGNETLDLTAAAFKVPGTVGKGLTFANTGHLWKSTNGMLRFSPTNSTPNADSQGLSVMPHRQAVAYSASISFSAALGTAAYIAATNGTAFTINAPSNATADEVLTITISNQSGGALGAITWNAVFKMAAFTAPANLFSRSVTFFYDGTNWIQIGQTGVDVPN